VGGPGAGLVGAWRHGRFRGGVCEVPFSTVMECVRVGGNKLMSGLGVESGFGRVDERQCARAIDVLRWGSKLWPRWWWRALVRGLRVDCCWMPCGRGLSWKGGRCGVFEWLCCVRCGP
jgi:hypothetical protein